MAVVGMAANPSEAHQAGRHRAGQILVPASRGGEAEGACRWAARPLPVEMCVGKLRYGTLHFVTPRTGSIEGSGIAASSACRSFDGC